MDNTGKYFEWTINFSHDKERKQKFIVYIKHETDNEIIVDGVTVITNNNKSTISGFVDETLVKQNIEFDRRKEISIYNYFLVLEMYQGKFKQQIQNAQKNINEIDKLLNPSGWLAVDADDTPHIFFERPKRFNDKWTSEHYFEINLSNLSSKYHEITWEDKPIKL